MSSLIISRSRCRDDPCVEGFVLFGDAQRTCLGNGSWSGAAPLCDFNVGAGKRSLQSGTLWSYSPGLALDGSPDTCSFTPRGPDPRWWQVHLGHKFNVIRVAVTISPGSLQEFTIYVIELLADNKALYKPCTAFKGVFQSHKAVFMCNDGLGHPGQFVYIRDDRKAEEYFGLCEVEVFAFRKRIPCGSPGVPVHGRVQVAGERQATYSCQRGFTLTGDATHSCSSKGKWEGQEPRCVEVQCPDVGLPGDGVTVVVAGRCGGVASQRSCVGSVARYSCRSGLRRRGNETRLCLHDGKWAGEPPDCVPVRCLELPSFPHARYTLLNSSALYHGIAVYTCLDGYRLANASSEMVTTCLDSGSWRVLNITCVPVTSTMWDFEDGKHRRSGTGRSLNYEIDRSFAHDALNNLSPQTAPATMASPLVMGLAIIASLLLIVVLVLLSIFAVRRHYLAGPGSLNPLLRYAGKRPPPFDTNYAQNGPTDRCGPTSDRGYNDSMNNGSRTPISSLYHHNILSSIGDTVNGTGIVSATGQVIQDNTSLSGSLGRLNEPPYERVRTRSEHSYETIRKLGQHVANAHDDDNGENVCYQQEPGYERLAGDKGSLWYETLDKGSVGYETVPEESAVRNNNTDADASNYQIQNEYNLNDCKDCDVGKSECSQHSKTKDPGYEKIKEKDHQYETLKEKDPGYESLKEKSSDSLTILKNDKSMHGYETVNTNDLSNTIDEKKPTVEVATTVPDILQDLDELGTPEKPSHATVPPEIFALYAQVDKSKKKKKNNNTNQNNSFTSTAANRTETEADRSPASDSMPQSNRPTPPPRPKGMAPQPPQALASSPSPHSHTQLQHTQSDSSNGKIKGADTPRKSSRELIHKFNKFSSDDLMRPSSSASSECTSPSGTLRPLPPIPKQ